MNMAADGNTGACRYVGTRLDRERPNLICRSAAGVVQDFCDEFVLTGIDLACYQPGAARGAGRAGLSGTCHRRLDGGMLFQRLIPSLRARDVVAVVLDLSGAYGQRRRVLSVRRAYELRGTIPGVTDRLACLPLASDLGGEVGAGGDAQLGEHVHQVSLDGPPGDE